MPENIILVAETGADIPRELAERYRIRTVPMHVSFGNTVKEDGAFPSEEICRYYDETGDLPKTSCSTPGDFTHAFDMIHREDPEAQILYLAYSAATTGSYQSAQIAAEGRDYVTSVDTKFASAGQCAVVIGTARMLEAHPEWTVQDAAAAAEELVRRCRMCFIPNDLKYLRAGGRVSNTAALFGELLNIHPLIEMLDGKLIPTKKLRGKMRTLAPKLVQDYVRDNGLDRDELWLIRTPRLPESIIDSAQEAARALGFRTVTWIWTGGVITTHGGPGAFGVVGFAADAPAP